MSDYLLKFSLVYTWLLVLWLASPSSSEFSFVRVYFQCRKWEVPFSMAIGNEELVQDCLEQQQ